ncbi:MAG TPA: hypothetical protein VGL40_03640 [Bacillota bacterium]
MDSTVGADYLFVKGPRDLKALVVPNVPATRVPDLTEQYKKLGWKMVVAGRFAVLGDGVGVEVPMGI